jgi:hypothetical protein
LPASITLSKPSIRFADAREIHPQRSGTEQEARLQQHRRRTRQHRRKHERRGRAQPCNACQAERRTPAEFVRARQDHAQAQRQIMQCCRPGHHQHQRHRSEPGECTQLS